VDGGAGHTRLLGDLLHAGRGIGAQHLLGGLEDRLDGALGVGAQWTHVIDVTVLN